MLKLLIEFTLGALLAALLICVLQASTHLCDSAMNNPQAFFAGRVH